MTIIPLLHASCVEKNGQGILLRGHAGSGKSSFALSLMNHGFRLVADDQVHLWESSGTLMAQAAESLKSMLEVRGMGILTFEATLQCQIHYVIDLLPGFKADRYPLPTYTQIHNVRVRSFQMDPLDSKSCEKALVLFHQDFRGFYEEDQNGIIASRA